LRHRRCVPAGGTGPARRAVLPPLPAPRRRRARSSLASPPRAGPPRTSTGPGRGMRDAARARPGRLRAGPLPGRVEDQTWFTLLVEQWDSQTRRTLLDCLGSFGAYVGWALIRTNLKQRRTPFAPEGRQSIARGASPWTQAFSAPSPSGAA